MMENLDELFFAELTIDELREKNGGQYFKPSIDGTFLTEMDKLDLSFYFIIKL